MLLTSIVPYIGMQAIGIFPFMHAIHGETTSTLERHDFTPSTVAVIVGTATATAHGTMEEATETTTVTMALACVTDSTADITTMAVAPLAMDRKEESLPMEEVAVMATCTIARVAFVIIKTYLTKIPTRCLDAGAVVHVPLLHSLHPTTTEAGVGVSVVADRLKFLITDLLSQIVHSPRTNHPVQVDNTLHNVPM